MATQTPHKIEMKEIKLTVDGKEVQLTDAQLKALNLDIELERQNPFKRVNDEYCYIEKSGNIWWNSDVNDQIDNTLYNNVNYFNDEQFARQVELHQLLYRKLLKFSYENECEDTKEWDGENRHWCIRYDHGDNAFDVTWYDTSQFLTVHFSTMESAARAIEEVVLPFKKEHPEFVW